MYPDQNEHIFFYIRTEGQINTIQRKWQAAKLIPKMLSSKNLNQSCQEKGGSFNTRQEPYIYVNEAEWFKNCCYGGTKEWPQALDTNTIQNTKYITPGCPTFFLNHGLLLK